MLHTFHRMPRRVHVMGRDALARSIVPTPRRCGSYPAPPAGRMPPYRSRGRMPCLQDKVSFDHLVVDSTVRKREPKETQDAESGALQLRISQFVSLQRAQHTIQSWGYTCKEVIVHGGGGLGSTVRQERRVSRTDHTECPYQSQRPWSRQVSRLSPPVRHLAPRRTTEGADSPVAPAPVPRPSRQARPPTRRQRGVPPND